MKKHLLNGNLSLDDFITQLDIHIGKDLNQFVHFDSNLFLDSSHSCRSQIAVGCTAKYWGHEFNAYFFGTKKHGMNERDMEVMKKAEVDISKHHSKIFHVGIEDPPSLTKEMTNEGEILAVYRKLRDEIQNVVKDLNNYLPK